MTMLAKVSHQQNPQKYCLVEHLQENNVEEF